MRQSSASLPDDQRESADRLKVQLPRCKQRRVNEKRAMANIMPIYRQIAYESKTSKRTAMIYAPAYEQEKT
jgi:hypothetical protein